MADAIEVTPATRAPLQRRYEKTFPALTAAETERVRPFGEFRRYAPGAALFEPGTPGPGTFAALMGQVVVALRDGIGRPLVRAAMAAAAA